MDSDTDNSVKTINVSRAYNRLGAAVDAEQRSKAAYKAHMSFFNSPTHAAKIEEVLDIVDSFFEVKNAVYVNHREGKGKPFTTIKVDRPKFPAYSSKRIDEEYRNPLKELGVEIVFSKGTNSYLYRIY